MFTRSCLCTTNNYANPSSWVYPICSFSLSPFTLPSFRPSYCTLGHSHSRFPDSSHPTPFHSYPHKLPFIPLEATHAQFAKRDEPVFTLIPSSFPLAYVSLFLFLFFFSFFVLKLTFYNLMPHTHANLDFDGHAQRVM